jgi:alkylation response protein AidB-like acyl-CoA dehydrogenase
MAATTTTTGTTDDLTAEVTAWLEANWDPELTVEEWWDRLGRSGWAVPTWPDEWFGKGLSRAESVRVMQTISGFPALGAPGGLGTLLAGPTIYTHGTDEQKQRYLPDIVTGKQAWCQLFSEPGAGSDLAGLNTRAELDGDEWVVNGQKVWTSGGHWSDLGMLLARTDPDVAKHQGITYFAVDMHQPGIEIRPLKELTGRAMFNEVFLTDVRVPVANRVGAENDGWRVTNVTLKYERGTAFVSELVDSLRLCADLAPYVHDPAQLRELGRCTAELDALWSLTKRNVSQSARGTVGPGAMVMKLAYSEARQRFGELALRVLDRDALHVDGNEQIEERLRVVALTIAAGASQIQRNIIGERVLGFPKEAR